jgi:hypothetical protein
MAGQKGGGLQTTRSQPCETQMALATDEENAVTVRPPMWHGGIKHWRDPRNQKEIDHEFVERVLALWDLARLDTWEIAQATHQSQASCERALHIGLEDRRCEAEARDAGGYTPVRED